MIPLKHNHSKTFLKTLLPVFDKILHFKQGHNKTRMALYICLHTINLIGKMSFPLNTEMPKSCLEPRIIYYKPGILSCTF